jgi:uncharacterized protein with von Willebrand factor type A (vWA) domain
MNNNKEREYIRLTNNDPLVLAVSALSDFLWDDFVREARPTVNYLVDRYNIRQLSRFGKELFDFLYNGGAVQPLVTLNDVEDYFRAKQNGQNPDFPQGYKPESAFWVNLFVGVCNTPAWPSLMAISVGDQFNAGNNAINIINELSEIITLQIEEQQLSVQMISGAAQELEQIRNEFMKAKEAGNLEAAAKLRQKGKEIGQALEEAVQKNQDQMQPKIAEAIDKALDAAQDFQEAMSSFAGNQKGEGTHLEDLEAKRKLAKKLQNNPSLQKLIKKLGGIRRAWNDRKRAKKAQSNYSDIIGAKFSDEVTNAFPAELALAGSPEGRALFALKYAQRTLLTKDYEAKVKEIERGPVVMYIDVSGSMTGVSETWSKAIAYVVAEECLKENREVQIHLFDTIVQKSITLNVGKTNENKLLDFVMTWVTRGGTSFGQVINHAVSVAKIDPKADILMITDGESEVPDPFIRRVKTFKESMDVQWTTFCIGKRFEIVKQFSDSVQVVDPSDDPGSAKLFQDALR